MPDPSPSARAGEGRDAPGASTHALTPLPCDLTRIPLVLSCKQQEHDPDGHLADPRYYQVEHTYYDGDLRRTARVTGDAELGITFGEDWDLWLATFALLDRHDAYDGWLSDRQVSIRAYARMLGKSDGPGTKFCDRVIGFLKRAGNMRVQLWLTRERTEQLALDLRRGRPDVFPELPGAIRSTEQVYETKPLLSPKISTHTDASGRSAVWIDHLSVDDWLVDQAITGHLALIDLAVLSETRSPIAKALYVTLAGRAARQPTLSRDERFVFRQAELRSQLQLSPSLRASKARDCIQRAGRALAEAGVLRAVGEGGVSYTGGRGDYTHQFRPGERLIEAYYQRGIGVLDRPWVRECMGWFGRLGVTHRKARELIRTRPERTRQVLRFVAWVLDHRPSFFHTNPAGFAVTFIENEYDLRQFELYRKDYLATRRAGSRSRSDRDPTPPSGEEAPPSSTPRAPVRCSVEPSEPEAERLWREAVGDGSWLTGEHAKCRPALEHLVGDRIEEGTLVCQGDNPFYLRWLRGVESAVTERVRSVTGETLGGWRVESVGEGA